MSSKRNPTTESQKQVDEKAASTEKSTQKSKKFKFECTRCGECCTNRGPIPVTVDDLARWTQQGSFMSIILPHLYLDSVSDQDEISKIALVPFIRMKDADENGIGDCPFYDDENKMCNIYFTLPVNCKTFPLAYNGEKFYVSDKSCPGIGKGKMTKEKLQEIRDTAVRDYEERTTTTLALIPLQGMFIRHFMEQSQQQIDQLSDEEREKLDKIIEKSKKASEQTKPQKQKDKEKNTADE
ncbi:MAG: YkgJ family cysteine cluster protein [Asgard group archaeon]|nr:YkgJ family cysteine cluster protein [Asgard group archaeon]